MCMCFDRKSCSQYVDTSQTRKRMFTCLLITAVSVTANTWAIAMGCPHFLESLWKKTVPFFQDPESTWKRNRVFKFWNLMWEGHGSPWVPVLHALMCKSHWNRSAIGSWMFLKSPSSCQLSPTVPSRLLPHVRGMTCLRMWRLLSRCPHSTSDWKHICLFPGYFWIFNWPSWTLADLLQWT